MQGAKEGVQVVQKRVHVQVLGLRTPAQRLAEGAVLREGLLGLGGRRLGIWVGPFSAHGARQVGLELLYQFGAIV